MAVALVKNTHQEGVFWFGHLQKHREEATTILTLVKGKAADPSWLLEGRNCPCASTRNKGCILKKLIARWQSRICHTRP